MRPARDPGHPHPKTGSSRGQERYGQRAEGVGAPDRDDRVAGQLARGVPDRAGVDVGEQLVWRGIGAGLGERHGGGDLLTPTPVTQPNRWQRRIHADQRLTEAQKAAHRRLRQHAPRLARKRLTIPADVGRRMEEVR